MDCKTCLFNRCNNGGSCGNKLDIVHGRDRKPCGSDGKDYFEEMFKEGDIVCSRGALTLTHWCITKINDEYFIGENRAREIKVLKPDFIYYTRSTVDKIRPNNMQPGIFYTQIKPIIKEKKVKELEKYEFKGEIDIDILMNDAFRDMRRSFIVMGKNNASVFIMTDTNMDVDDFSDEVIYDSEKQKFVKVYSNMIFPYIAKIIDKKTVHEWLIKLKEENKEFNKSMLKKKDKNRKNKSKSSDRFKVFLV